jgi:hypothetical protein
MKVLIKSGPGMKTNADKVACWEGKRFMTSAGPCTVPSLADAPLK